MNPFKAWNHFLFAPVSARPLGIFRIVFGVLMIIYLLVMTVEFDFWYTDQGLLQGAESLEAAGPFRISPLHYVHDSYTPKALWVVTFAAAVGMTLGWRTRLMSFLFWVGLLSFYHRNPSSNGGPDVTPVLFSFYMMLCPSGAAYSLDARRETRRRGTEADPIIVPWSLRLLQMQLCLIYFHSCIIKCQGPTWLNGTATHYVLFNYEFNWFNFQWLGGYPLLVNFMTHSALMIEFALAFWLWFKPTRRWAIIGGLLLHAGIRPILNITGFGELMCATYLAFLDHEEATALLKALDPRTWLARLGLRRPEWPLLRGPEPSLPIPSWQQRERAFDRDGRAVPEPIVVR